MYYLAFWIVYFLATLPSWNKVSEVKIFIHHIMGDIYTYDYANKLFISFGEIDHDMAEDLQRCITPHSRVIYPVLSQKDHVYQQNVHFNNDFL